MNKKRKKKIFSFLIITFPFEEKAFKHYLQHPFLNSESLEMLFFRFNG